MQPALLAESLFLVEAKVMMGGKKIEVYVDGDVNVTIDQCAHLSRELEKQIEASGLAPENYLLEVGSPGMSNPLRVPRQYRKRVGRPLDVWTMKGEYVTGELTTVTETGIVLREVREQKSKTQELKARKNKTQEAPLQEWPLKFEDIRKATLQLNF